MATAYDIHGIVNTPPGSRWLAAYWSPTTQQHTFRLVNIMSLVQEPSPSEVRLIVGMVFDHVSGSFLVAQNIEEEGRTFCSLAEDTYAPFRYVCPLGHVSP
jgi:hypothetical protein